MNAMSMLTPMSKKRLHLLSLGILALGICLPAAATAQRKSPLEDAPAIRNKVELRKSRAELGVAMGSSVDQDFYHAVMLTIRGSFHINDFIGIGGFVGLNVSPTFKTGFTEELERVLPNTNDGTKAPPGPEALDSMNHITQMFGLQLEATPFAGKFSLFGKTSLNYDFYGFAGRGFLGLAVGSSNLAACGPDAGDVRYSCAVSGLKFGANFGIGIHAFLNQFVAVNVELRDMFIRNNPSGRDVNGDKTANNDDLTWDSNYIATVGIVLFLPTTASISP